MSAKGAFAGQLSLTSSATVCDAGKSEIGFHFTHDTGDVVGGPAAFCNALPNYAATAMGPAVVLRIPQQEFYDQAEEHGRLLRGTLAYLALELEALQAAS